MTRIERAFGILLLLSDRRSVTAPELARRFEVSVRTIYRDVEMLSATGVPVYAERGAGGGYRLLEGYFLPPVTFTRGETVAALVGLALARGLRVPPFAGELETAQRKLVAALPARLRPLLLDGHRLIGVERPAADAFHPEPEGPDGDAARLAEARAVELFLGGVLDATRVRFTYRSPYRPAAEAIEAEPLGLLWDRDRWYLIGNRLGPDRPRRRFWRADRVAAIEASTFRVDQQPFDVRPHLGRRWLADAMARWSRLSPVRIGMTADQARRLAADWYFGFGAFEPDGPDRVIMTYGESDPDKVLELVRWLGPGAELLAPAEWRPRLGRELATLAAAYGA